MAGDAGLMPFSDRSFHAVFSNGSLHHWLDPSAVFSEIARVIKPGGAIVVQDGRRDIGWGAWVLYQLLSSIAALDLTVPGRLMRRGWRTSIQAGYTPAELTAILEASGLKDWRVEQKLFDLLVRSEPGAGS